MKANKGGWSFAPLYPSRRRHEDITRDFHRTEVPANPACAAWDEPGYVDPELKHSGLPLGARYWQGFAKPCRIPRSAKEERAMSPEWVASVTEPLPHEHVADRDTPDPHWHRVVRIHERERSGLERASGATSWPG